MIADLFFSLLLAIWILMIGWNIYLVGYDMGERDCRKETKSKEAETTSEE